MKKRFTSFAVALSLIASSGITAFAATSEPETAIVNQNSFNMRDTYPINGDQVYSGSQMLYPASMLSAATNGVEKFTITDIEFKQSGTQNPVDFQIQVYYTTTDKTDLSAGGFNEADMTLVYESGYSVGDGKLHFTLDKPIVLNNGENLVLGIKGVRNGGMLWPYYYVGSGQTSCVRAYASSSPFEFTTTGGDIDNCAAMLTITYVEGEIGGGTSAEPKTVTILDNSTYNRDTYPINGEVTYSGSQMLYSSSLLSEATGGAEKFSITELGFIQSNTNMTSACDYQMEIYYATTDKTSLSNGGVAESDMTLVFEGAAVVGNGALTFTLDKPIVLNKGENLLLGIKGVRDGGMFWPSYYIGSGQSSCVRAYSSSSAFEFTANGGELNDNPSRLQFTFVEGEVGSTNPGTDVYDLVAESITGPTTVTAGETYQFDVKVFNNGNQAIESYNVSVAIQAENGEETEVGKVEDCDRLVKGMSATIPVNVVIPNAGNYNLVARVFTDPDNDPSNDVSEPFAVAAVKLNVKAAGITAPQTVKIDEEFEVAITVANEGTTPDKNYTVSVVALDAKGNVEKTLAEVTNVPEIAAGSQASVKIPVTLNFAGTYRLQGIVEVGGYDATTTEIAVVEATFEKLPGQHDITMPKDGATSAMNNFVTRNYVKNISQVLYTPDMLESIERNAQIQSLTFTFIAPEYLTSIPTKIEFASVAGLSKLDKNSPVAQDKFTTVFDGNITYEPTTDNLKVTVEMGCNFMLKKGESLVIMTTCEGEQSGWTPYIVSAATEQYHTISTRTDNESTAQNLTLYNTSAAYSFAAVPVVTLGYALEPLPPSVDLEMVNFTAPTEVKLGDEATFKADLRNNGTIAADSYTLELVEMSADDKVVKVLATNEVDDALGAGGEAFNQKVKYTFDAVGTYKVAMRVVAADDTDEANNLSTVATVTVVDTPSFVEGIASENASIRCEEGVVTFPSAAVSGTIVDIAGRLIHNGVAQVRLPKGAYVVTATFADGRVSSSKLVVK